MFNLNRLKNFLPKFLNKNQYLKNKKLLQIENEKKLFKENYEQYIYKIQETIREKKEISFLHSGHAGDMVLAFPVIKELSKTHRCKLFIQLNQEMSTYYENHPAGNVYINKRICDFLLPLIRKQSYINSVEIFNNQSIDINLDIIRKLPLNLTFDNMRYAMHVTGTQADLNKNFLECDEHKILNKKIVIHRSARYQNNFIKYNFLEDYEDAYFVGTHDEYKDLKKNLRNLQFYDCKDFLEMAMLIKSSKVFIGNSSIGFIIAEGLKVPRLLEASPHFPAAQVHGEKAYDFYFQPHFEKYFHILYKNN